MVFGIEMARDLEDLRNIVTLLAAKEVAVKLMKEEFKLVLMIIIFYNIFYFNFG